MDEVLGQARAGVLAGPRFHARTIARLAHEQGWRDLNLVICVAVCLAESEGYTRAYNDNIRNGEIHSRDVGLMQINIPASQVGTDAETRLYDPEYNMERARDMFVARHWQPWVAYNSGRALDPDAQWKYAHRAVKGVANFYAYNLLKLRPVPLLDFA